MDGFFRILNKALSELISTKMYFDFLPRRLFTIGILGTFTNKTLCFDHTANPNPVRLTRNSL
jgi:hypothetical protein